MSSPPPPPPRATTGMVSDRLRLGAGYRGRLSGVGDSRSSDHVGAPSHRQLPRAVRLQRGTGESTSEWRQERRNSRKLFVVCLSLPNFFVVGALGIG